MNKTMLKRYDYTLKKRLMNSMYFRIISSIDASIFSVSTLHDDVTHASIDPRIPHEVGIEHLR